MTKGQRTDEQTGELRCRCGYLLQGLTEKRCPECGRPFPGKPRRKKYLLSGFLIGFGIVAAPTLVWLAFLFFMISDQSGAEAAFTLMYAGVGLAIAVVSMACRAVRPSRRS